MLNIDSLEGYWRFEKDVDYLYFDGSNDYVSVSDSTDFHFGSGDFSIGLWALVNEADSSTTRSLIGQGGGSYNYGSTGIEWCIYKYATDEKLYFGVNQGYSKTTVVSTSSVTLGYAWHYYTISKSGTTATIYLDGVSVGSGTISGSITTVSSGTPRLRIGEESTGTLPWNDFIRNVRIYKGTALTQSEIKGIIKSERQAPTTNLVANWAMDEGTGSSIYDSSGNDHTGTISGASWTTQIQDDAHGLYPAKLYGAASSPAASGKFGNSYSNAGGTGYAYILRGINCGNYLTISCWALVSDSTRRTIYSHGSESASLYQLEVNRNGTYEVGVIIPGTYMAYTGSGVISAGTYYHIVYTRNGTGNTHKIYINGVEQSLSTTATDSYGSTTTRESNLGARDYDKQFWKGNIDELMIFNKALGLTDIKRLMMGLHPLAN